MTDFLIKSTLSLTALLVVYFSLLEREKMHQFNRFYLLFSLLFSFAIPFITIEIIQQIPQQETMPTIIPMTEETSMPVIEDTTNYWLISAWSLYSVITLSLLLRFVVNIWKLNAKAQSNPTINYKNAKLVLLKEKTLPYTFLNYIFINETDYNDRKIEDELYTHELIHVNQKHTLDILFIEILKVIFWFNPIFIFYKKAIQLNHEFLADEKVVKSHNNVPFYQNLLLSKANVNPTYYLASNLNYSVTKKRLIMMTKNTSTTRALLKKGILIPLLTALVFSLCTKVVAQETPQKEGKNVYVNGEAYYKKTTFEIKDEKGKVVAKKKYSDLTAKQKQLAPPLVIRSNNDKPLSEKEIIEKIEKEEPKTFIIDEFDPKNSKTKQQDPNTIYNTAGLTEKPEFSGGMDAFYKFVGDNFVTPKTPDGNTLRGKVYLTFIVEKDGNLSNFKIIRDNFGYGAGEEAIRVLKTSPKWTPGEINGEAVRTLYSLPIAIQSKS
ncbi:Signal transducer regulating beta-lactamase production, contains metallopeptidase domain [Flavobacterium flevense]|uniref:M56 family metallopeptidase n=2 Tax=Flavobacterium flevense TaxID=983 RepID=UPI0009197C74|nr:M56 family metallopeptidase [Flavobacterium flevense]SHL72984.1 Signal transducer regulating beta-lactamase production, contains metallopeptidase domain [Flavobacterium flevense]